MTLIKRWLLAALIGLGIIALPGVAYAQVDTPSTVGSIQLSPLVVTAIVALFVPLGVGLLTKIDLSPTWKGAVNIVLSAINAAVVTATVADGTAIFSQETLVAAFFGMVVSLATYLQIYKPLDINTKLLPDKGI